MSGIKHDRMIYFVLCAYRDGKAWAERDLGRTNRKDTLEDIMSGELPAVQMVIELNYTEFTSRDVTDEFVFEPCGRGMSAAERATAAYDHAREHRKNEVA